MNPPNHPPRDNINAPTQLAVYPEILSDLAAMVSEQLVEKYKFSEDDAVEMGSEIAEFVRGHYAGQQIYFPKGSQVELSRRDRRIIELYNGNNVIELGMMFKISTMRVRQIINLDRRRLQMKLL